MDSATRKAIRNRGDELAAAAGCYFDERAADRVIEFFPRFLRHSKGSFAGKPFELSSWQRVDVVSPLYGWKRPDGSRRFRRAYIEIPKKNGKSTLAAGLGLYHLAGDGERGAEVYSAAVNRDQASIVHGEAIAMTNASDALSSYLRVNKATKEILLEKYGSRYRALASEAQSAEGLNASALIIDELHAWTGEHGRRFFDSLKYAGRARRQPLTFIITTAGEDELGVCWLIHQDAAGLLRGEVTDQRFFAYIRAADPGDDISDPATWRKANPSMGETMSEEDFAADLEEAKRNPTNLAQFLRYSLNTWTFGGGSPAIDPQEWEACRADFTEDDCIGLECWGALDLSRKKDFTAFALTFKVAEDSFRVLAWYWLPEDTVNAPNSPPQYQQWVKDGFLRATPGNVTDYRQVEADITEILKRHACYCVLFDPLFAEEMTQRIYEATGVERVEFKQSPMSFTAPSDEFERMIAGRQLQHNGNPILTWNAHNLRFKLSGNFRAPVKPGESLPKKIDGIVCVIMTAAKAIEEKGNEQSLTWA